MDAVLKHVGYVLSHAAHLLGHYDGLENPAMDSDGMLERFIFWRKHIQR
jgi:hypothetical protein